MSGHATPHPSTPGGGPPHVPDDADTRRSDDCSALLAAAARGEEPAWRLVVDRYARRIFALARSRLKSPELAEEVTQSVLATVASRLGSGGYAEQGRFESWLFRITMNRVRDEARRASRHATPTDPALLPPRIQDSAPSEPAIDLRALRHALLQLPDQDREVIELRHHAQMSFKAIADLLEEPLGTLLARHHRALRKLRSLLLPHTPDHADASKEGAPSPLGDPSDHARPARVRARGTNQ